MRRIATRFRPRKVILFGSHAYGTPTRDSDADLRLITETQPPNVEQAVEIGREISFPFATDLIIRTPQQIAERLALSDAFLQEILGKGVVLYEANDPGMD